MDSYKDIDISNYTDDFIRKAIFDQIKRRKAGCKAVLKYLKTEKGRAKSNHYSKCYYWRVKKNNAYHPEYNPNGIKSEK